jgi:DNA-binding beta-propeller fold protein YncE
MEHPIPPGHSFLSLRRLVVAAGTLLVAGLAVYFLGRNLSYGPLAQAVAQDDQGEKPTRPRRLAPELDGGTDWLNTAAPLHLKDLRGKIVVLDFWTSCCINCIHTIPDLARLEKKYADQLVVIGIHTPKFDNEKSSESIRKAVHRYEVHHPVVNDANMKIWRAYGVSSWPTLVLIDPEGYLIGGAPGEGLYDIFDEEINKLVQIHRAKKTLNEKPLQFKSDGGPDKGDSPLFFPGKVLADQAGQRLFIADSTHHRIVITDLGGKKIAIAGIGTPGKADGSFQQAAFNDPQGMAFDGDTLYVADRKNHLIRALDLKTHTVKTIAGTGEQGIKRQYSGPPLEVGLNSPWDLCLQGSNLYIALAGHHQIWRLDLAKNMIATFAGTGMENIRDGARVQSCFAQPSGLAIDSDTLYVADSEVSAVRAIPLSSAEDVRTVVGTGLFDFGDDDGTGDEVHLQHALGIAAHKGKLYVADTYNHKIKMIDPEKRTCTSFVGDKTKNGNGLFNHPSGLSFAGEKLYVADTNNHRIRVVDLASKQITTLPLQGVTAPQKVQASLLPR